MSNNGIEKSFTHTLKESDLGNLVYSFGEFTLDLFLKDDLIKNIPVFSTLQSFYKIGKTMHDHFFLQKLYRFLVGLIGINADKRKKMIEKLESDNKFNNKVGEYIMLLLDKIDDMQKPELLAKAFIAFIKGKINSVQLQRFNFGISNGLTCNLYELKKYYEKDLPDNVAHKELDAMVFQNLANCGFVDLNAGYGGGVGTSKNELGRLFVKFVLCD